MKQINPAKLPNSKWTAVKPLNREKHFVVCKVVYAEDGSVDLCMIESVLSRKQYTIDWVVLKNNEQWLYGWK